MARQQCPAVRRGVSMSPRVSVIVPTFQRRELVTAAVASLETQRFDAAFEVIVVVDGSTDGSAAALRAMGAGVPLTVLEQVNGGAARARNAGAAIAAGEILLFLDDDMEADPGLLAEHDRLHRAGAMVVSGHMPLHPASTGLLSTAVGIWSEDRLRRLSASRGDLDFGEILTGQVSIARALFEEVGGFDERFTDGGTYGNEDLDFGARLLARGATATFAPRAISHQRYIVTPRQHLRQWRETGRADVAFARKHPDAAARLFEGRGRGRRSYRMLWSPVASVPLLGSVLSAALRPPVLRLAAGEFTPRRFRAFRFVQRLEYWRGVGEGGGVPAARTVTVLAYHAIADLDDDVLRPYGVPPREFERQLHTLARAGFRFVSPGEVADLLAGRGGVPRRALLLTFDDCYADIGGVAAPILMRLRLPALAFAVSSLVGSVNRWDEGQGRISLRLLDRDGLAALTDGGFEIGAHSRTHPRLPRVDEATLRDEVGGCLDELAGLGLGRPRFFAYPYGEADDRVVGAVREAGLSAAFTVAPGRIGRGDDPLRLPRVQILRGDDGPRLLVKVALAGRLGWFGRLVTRG